MPEGETLQTLARKAMALARNHIVMHLRFMDMAVFRLRAMPADTTLATEGAHLFYGDKYVLRRYLRFDQQGLSRDYLHVVLHCVFRHPFIHSLVEASRWDIASDIAVEAMILSMDDSHFARPGDDARRAVIERLRGEAGLLSAERLYRHFADHPPELGWYDLFCVDDHVLWHKPKQARDMAQSGRDQSGDGDAEGGGAPPKPDGGNPPEAEDVESDPAKAPSGEQNADEGGDRAPGGESTPAEPGEPNEAGASSSSAGGDPGDSEAAERREAAYTEESEGKTGRSAGVFDEKHVSDQRNVGRGMNTEGREGMPAGSQSRNESTDGGLDARHSMGIGGDSGDARSQSDDASSGGSGAGLNDAIFAPGESVGESEPVTEERGADEDREQLEREWRDVGERIQTDLETFSRRRGASAGDMLEQLHALNRERIDYAAFLRKFAVLGEAAELNDDEFDQIFYTYGLKLYKNLPLIEPLETREVLRVRDFVIAIDTSGSTSGALVRRFLELTWRILKGEENFFRRVNLHIIQCDAEVREAVHIESQREFDAYMDTFAVKGLGGTDFRPVFRYVDALLAEGAFTRLKGLIYFTDGAGTYPARKPDYETAFVFASDGRELPAVPPWAMRVELDGGEGIRQ